MNAGYTSVALPLMLTSLFGVRGPLCLLWEQVMLMGHGRSTDKVLVMYIWGDYLMDLTTDTSVMEFILNELGLMIEINDA